MLTHRSPSSLAAVGLWEQFSVLLRIETPEALAERLQRAVTHVNNSFNVRGLCMELPARLRAPVQATATGCRSKRCNKVFAEHVHTFSLCRIPRGQEEAMAPPCFHERMSHVSKASVRWGSTGFRRGSTGDPKGLRIHFWDSAMF